jgi:RNA polymerase sigma factor (sigma-70 family)
MENQLISAQADTLTEPSDADLVRRARTTEGQAAFAALYRRYLTPVYRYFYARTGGVWQAEDLTAQTFVAALEGLPRYRERGTFAGWLFTIAARRLADHFRHRPTVPLDNIADRPSPDPLPEASVEHVEQMTRLARAVRTLSPGRAQAVALHFFGGLSLGETARVMGRSRVAVKSLIHRALRDLREKLDDGRE